MVTTHIYLFSHRCSSFFWERVFVFTKFTNQNASLSSETDGSFFLLGDSLIVRHKNPFDSWILRLYRQLRRESSEEGREISGSDSLRWDLVLSTPLWSPKAGGTFGRSNTNLAHKSKMRSSWCNNGSCHCMHCLVVLALASCPWLVSWPWLSSWPWLVSWPWTPKRTFDTSFEVGEGLKTKVRYPIRISKLLFTPHGGFLKLPGVKLTLERSSFLCQIKRVLGFFQINPKNFRELWESSPEDGTSNGLFSII